MDDAMLTIKVLPANCGDCIVINFNDADRIKNILIDGGSGTIYDDVLKDEIIKIKKKNESIDLLIVTHIDNDHIGGIIKFIEDDENNDCIKEVWFNSWTNFGHKAEKLSHTGNEISAKEARTLENKLKNLNIWNDNLIKEGMVRSYNKAKITVMSPDEERLENLQHYIKDEFQISESDDRKKSIEILQERKFKEDTSIPNGSSIAFIFEYESKKLLFLGDSFPSVVLNGLKKVNFIDGTKNVKFDYVKVSHHGSRYNTDNKFLEKIECQNYIVTTMGCKGKPNKETFARISKYHQPLNLFFNYKNRKTQDIFSNDELKEYKISEYYLCDNPEPYLIKVI